MTQSNSERAAPKRRTRVTYNKDRIIADLKSRAFELARYLCPPPAFKQGHYYFPVNPTRTDRSPGSFYIHVGGPKVGGWYDAATDEKLSLIHISEPTRPY